MANHTRYTRLQGTNQGINDPEQAKKAVVIWSILLSTLLTVGLFSVAYNHKRVHRENSDNTPKTTVESPTISEVDSMVTPEGKNTAIKNPSHSCKSNVCKNILDQMDLTIDPCQDFFKFSCGNWKTQYPRQKGSQHWTNFVRLDRKNQQVIKKGIEDRGKYTHNSAAAKKAKKFYNQCLQRNDVSLSDSKKQLDTIFSSVNFTIGSEDPSTDLAKLLGSLYTNFGVQPFFSLKVGINDKDSSEHILKVDEPTFTLGARHFYTETEQEKTRPALITYMKDLFGLLENDKNIPDDVFVNISRLEFSIALQEAKPSQHRILAHSPSFFGLEQLQEKYKFLNWEQFLKTIIKSEDEETISEDDEIDVISDQFLNEISKEIDELLKTDNGRKLVSLFCFWRLYDNLVMDLSQPFRLLNQRLKEKIKGVSESPAKKVTWKICIKATEDLFKNVISNIYLVETEAFDSDIVEHVEDILEKVHETVDNNLNSSSWMDKKTKKAALKKSKDIVGLVGYPDMLEDVNKIKKQYTNIKIKTTYLETILSHTKNKHLPAKIWSRLQKAVPEHSWASAPYKINAFYAASMNQILIPFGILQEPFYSEDRPEELNYGAIGFSIGHELSHAFDDNGRRYDGHGNLKNWWGEVAEQKFKDRKKCLEYQFGNYTMFEHSVNGKNTLGETIADNGGIMAAWKAFSSEKDDDDGMADTRLETGFTAEQLFFLGYSQVWCGDNTDLYEIEKILKDPHPPSKVRVNAAVSNSEGFSTAFNCPLGSPMNPQSKCNIWK